jgi:DNA-binding transcriptional MerR regulator
MRDARFPIRVLSARSGVPVATIKFYLREGLLPKGAPAGGTQAAYGEAHVRRLATIGVLTGLGRMSLREAGETLAAIDGAPTGAETPEDEDPELSATRREVHAYLDRELGWRARADSTEVRDLARALLALRRTGRQVGADIFRPYARAAAWLVTEDLERIDRTSVAEQALVASIAADVAMYALRRLARTHVGGPAEAHGLARPDREPEAT